MAAWWSFDPLQQRNKNDQKRAENRYELCLSTT